MKTLLLSLSVLIVAVVVVYSASLDLSPKEKVLVQQYLRNLQKHRQTRLTKYEYKNCGDPNKEVANVSSLVFSPDPLVFPGPLQVNFDIGIKRTIHEPMPGSVLIEVMVGSKWVKVPCVGMIGSCDYEDICALLQQIPECPPQFISAGIPCQCPFNQGQYKLPQTEFDVPVAIFPPGNYHGIVNLTNNGDLVSCSELYVTFG